MTHEGRAIGLRKVILSVLLLVALTLGAMAAAPRAIDAASNCTYYSDATYTTVVGQFGYDCCNNRVAWGVKTQYSRCSSGCFICYPPPR